jgi:AcrR family transcriptional regulator
VSELRVSPPRLRRRRADAERSIAAILDAAARVLGRDPQASVEEIAKAAGTSRQTVYAHFPSRDHLLSALIEWATDRVVAELDAANLDSVSASQGLARLLEIGWQAFEFEPFLLNLPSPTQTRTEDRVLHEPVVAHLERLIRRGRRDGEFDRKLPVNWMVATTIALGHAAGEEVRAGRMTSRKARAVLQDGLSRLFRA